jgi:hypothetical protein
MRLVPNQCYLKTNWEKPKREQKEIMKLDYKKLANTLLEYVLETINMDIVEITELFLEKGFSYDDILSLGFEQETINQAQERINKGLGE